MMGDSATADGSTSRPTPANLPATGANALTGRMAKRSLRILLTNHQLGEPGGSEVNVRDSALGLLRRGHRPIAYAPKLGRTADFLRQQTIPVVDDLALITEPPDVVHGSHTPTIIESIVRFPQVPALQICQSTGYPMSEPLFLPQVRKFIAVDENTQDYLLSAGVAPEKIRVVHNTVDLRRIPRRPHPLPDRPKRALVFTKTAAQVPIAVEACRRAGIEVTTLGRGVGRVVTDPERELIEYDLIFATARSALEAIAAGAATIVMDGRGLAGMATRASAAWLRRHNFGARSLMHEVTVESIAAEIERYDAREAAALSADLRPLIDIEPQLNLFESLHDEIIDDFAASPLGERDLIATLGPVLHRWLPQFPGTDWPWQFERASMADRIAQLDAALAAERSDAIRAENEARDRLHEFQRAIAETEAKYQAARNELAAIETERTNAAVETHTAQGEAMALRAALESARVETAALRQELTEMKRSAFWRLREEIVRRPALYNTFRSLFGLRRRSP